MTECVGDVTGDAKVRFLDILGGLTLAGVFIGVFFVSHFFFACLVPLLIESGSLVLAVQQII